MWDLNQTNIFAIAAMGQLMAKKKKMTITEIEQDGVEAAKFYGYKGREDRTRTTKAY